MTITRDEGRLFAQLTGQPQVEILAETPTKFLYRVVDAQIEFAVDADGRAEKLTLRQAGATGVTDPSTYGLFHPFLASAPKVS